MDRWSLYAHSEVKNCTCVDILLTVLLSIFIVLLTVLLSIFIVLLTVLLSIFIVLLTVLLSIFICFADRASQYIYLFC